MTTREASLRLRAFCGDRLPATALLFFGFWAGYFAVGWTLDPTRARSLATPLDDALPFVPATVFLYIQVYSLALLPLFVVRSSALFRRVVLAYATVIAVCLLLFALVPVTAAELRVAPAQLDAGRFDGWLVGLVYRIDPPLNLFPSIHLAIASLAAASAFTARRSHGVVVGLLLVPIAISILHRQAALRGGRHRGDRGRARGLVDLGADASGRSLRAGRLRLGWARPLLPGSCDLAARRLRGLSLGARDVRMSRSAAGWIVAMMLLAAPPLRADTLIEIVTVGPGTIPYQRYGHSLLRIVDPESGRDVAVDFGAPDYDQLRMMLAFIRGHGTYHVVVTPWSERLARLRAQDRTVEVQSLVLDDAASAVIREAISAIEQDREQGRYLYDHLDRNCATLLAELVDRATGGALRQGAERFDPGHTYRDHALIGASGHWPVLAFLDIAPGPRYDAVPRGWALRFLPSYVKLAAAAARDTNGRLLVKRTRFEHVREGPPPVRGNPFAIRWLAVALAALVLLLAVVARIARGRERGGAVAVRAAAAGLLVTSGFSGLIGVLLWMLLPFWGLSDARWNLNVLLFVPFDLALAARIVPALRGQGVLLDARWARYLDARLVLVVCIGALGLASVTEQHNLAYALASGCGLIALRILARPGGDVPTAAQAPLLRGNDT